MTAKELIEKLSKCPRILRQHRSKEWKKEQLYRLLTEFDGKDYKE